MYISAITAKFTSAKVAGFMIADIFPTFICILFKSSFLVSKSEISSFSLQNALITRVPSRFSRVLPSRPSNRCCTFLYSGIQTSITANTTAASTGTATVNTTAEPESTVNAIITAPKTTNGERKTRRRVRFVPVCTWLISPVSLVIRVDAPSESSCENESLSICENSLLLISVAKPTAAFAEKYCATIAHKSPPTAKSANTPHIFKI